MLITYIKYCQKLCKSALRYQAEALDLKLRIKHVHRDQTRNGFRGTNSFFKCTPIIIFAAGHVRQQNGAKTIQNLSFRPKVVDWACLLQKNKKRF